MKKLWKNNNAFVDPQQIMAVIVCLMILGIGAFAVMITISSTQDVGPSPSGSKCWNIGTPSNPETYNGLPTNTNAITSVTEYYNDGSSSAIGAGDYTWTETNPTYISVNVTGG